MKPPGTATGHDHVELFVAAAERFAIAVADTDLQAPVPGCPGWSAYDLVVHVGNVHAWAATIVETGRRAVHQNDEPRSRKARVVSEWYAGKAEDLYEVLRATDPARPCWNFAFGEGETGFWRRRQLHETTIHQVDLDAAVDRETAIDTGVAADGVDEVLTVFLHRMHQRGFPAALTAPVCLMATDAGRAWTVSPRAFVPDPSLGVPPQPRGSSSETAPALIEGPPRVVERRHPRADQVAGPADVLYRMLWKRLPADEVDRLVATDGDEGRLAAFLGSRLTP